MKKQKLPKWFNGELYKDGAEVTNPFSKEKYKLNNIELSMYDFIMGATIAMEMGIINNKITKEHIRGLNWFKQNNIKAYMVLLD
jgi:hypothetical protein